jgi:hypothetical protein
VSSVIVQEKNPRSSFGVSERPHLCRDFYSYNLGKSSLI